ncbi:glycosyltransferase [Geodermatophilus sp. SYSU D00700]
MTLFVRQGYAASPHELGVSPDVEVVDLHVPHARRLPTRVASFIHRVLAGELTPGRRAVDRWIRQMVARAPRLDVVEVHWSQHFRIVEGLRESYPSSLLVAYAHDVMTQALGRRSVAAPVLLRRLAARVATARAAKLEPWLLNKFDAVATFSEKDEALLRSLGVRVPVRVEQLHFDLPRTTAVLSEPIVLFVGAMYRPENDQAAKWLVSDIWPTIRSAVPGAKLLIVGSGPSAKLQALAAQAEGVRVVGYIPDLSAAYCQASVVVAPLITGAGIKLKVVEAFAHGVPVVGTTVAAEGFPPHLFSGIADEAVGLAKHVVQLLGDPIAKRSAAAAGRRWAERAHKRVMRDIEASVERYWSVATGRGDGLR